MNPSEGLQLRSTVKAERMVEVAVVRVPVPEPKADEVVVRIEASPINPSDLGMVFAGADLSRARPGGTAELPTITAPISPEQLHLLAARVGQSLAVGNEGAGTVVAAGSAPHTQGLLGQVVGVMGGEMCSQFRCLKVAQCQPFPKGTTPAQGAAWFINPLTALCMLETLRREGHRALIHTAAASNLGRMLVLL